MCLLGVQHQHGPPQVPGTLRELGRVRKEVKEYISSEDHRGQSWVLIGV